MIFKVAKEAQQEERKLWSDHEEESTKKMAEAGAIVNEVPQQERVPGADKPVWAKYGAHHADLIRRLQDVSDRCTRSREAGRPLEARVGSFPIVSFGS